MIEPLHPRKVSLKSLVFCRILIEELFTTQSWLLLTLSKKPFENIVGKGENDGNQHFLLFPTMFSSQSVTQIIIWITFEMLSANAFKLDWYQIFLFGKELILSFIMWKALPRRMS